MSSWIAEQPVIFVYPNGGRVAGRIAVGLPLRIDAVEARCSIWMEGVDRSPMAIVASDTLQALMLAVRFAGMRLHDFLSKGGRIVDPDEGLDVPLETIFGVMLRQPPTTETKVRTRRDVRRQSPRAVRQRSPRRVARKK